MQQHAERTPRLRLADAPDILTVDELLAYLPPRTGRNLIYCEIASGRLKAVRLGLHKLIIPKNSLLAWLESAGQSADARPGEPVPIARRRAVAR